MGAAVEVKKEHEFNWVASSEPHSARRRAILAKHGDEVRALYGHDWTTGAQVMAVMAVTIATAFAVRDAPWWKVWLAAYAIGGTASQNLFCAQHELSHFLAYKRPIYNRALSFASNCPLVVPMATAFRKYHQEHHSHLGVDGWDVDLPTSLERSAISNLFTKLAWVASYLAIYGLRPLIVRPKKPDASDVACLALVLGFDAAVLYFWGIKSFVYLLAGTLLGGGLHPMAGHLIAEHYTFVRGQETYSYYGPLNALTYNVGFHNEHHDFPQIPHTRLHRLREIAPEFYEPLARHASWCWVIWTFLADSDVGPWTRIKRKERGANSDVPGAVGEYLASLERQDKLEREEEERRRKKTTTTRSSAKGGSDADDAAADDGTSPVGASSAAAAAAGKGKASSPSSSPPSLRSKVFGSVRATRASARKQVAAAAGGVVS